MALVGNLRDLKLPNLIQLNCMERNSAKLTIEHAGKYGMIYFHEGQVVHAEFDPDIGEKALFRLLGLPEGKFKVENGVRAPMSTDFQDDKEFALQALSFYEAEKISGLLKKEKSQFITLVTQSKRIILTEYDKDIIYLDIEAKYQLETILPFIEQVLI
jgi:hypothetical protein